MIIVRQAEMADIKSIFNVETHCFVYGIRAETDEPFIEQLLKYPKGMMVAEANGEVVGYIMGELVPKGWDLKLQHNFFQDGDYLYITSFAVLSSHQGCGRTLVKTFVASIPGKTIIGVVNPKWERVCRLYKLFGAKETGTLEDFFHPDLGSEPGIVMEF